MLEEDPKNEGADENAEICDGEAESGEVKNSEQEDEDDSDLEAEFEFWNPTEDDFTLVRGMLQAGMWDVYGVDLTELADSIVGQGNVGTFMRSDGGDESTLCAILTALNMRQFPELGWPKTIEKLFVRKAKEAEEANIVMKLEQLFARRGKGIEIGLLINEHAANLPPATIPQLHAMVEEDIKWSCETPECPKDEQPFYRFTHFLGIAKCSVKRPKVGDASSSAVKRRRKNDSERVVSFLNFDEEAFVRRSDFSFSFEVQSAEKKKGAPGMFRTAYCISRDVFATSEVDLLRVLGEDAE